MKNILLAVAIMILPGVAWANDMVNKLQDISVTVTTSSGSGSGVLKTRKVGNDNVTFVWTAAHVVDGLRNVRHIVDTKTGTRREVVEFEDANVVQTINEDGRLVARFSALAEVVKFSKEEDLALLRIRKKNFSTNSVQFYLDKKLPSLGDDVWNVGSALGIQGSNTVSKGVMSQYGRILSNKKVYDQVSCPGFPGCSGSGVYLNDGRMMGMLTNGAGETFILVVPTRRIVDWAKTSGIDWAVDDNIEMPSDKELRRIIVEDNGISFSAERAAAPGAKKMLLVNPLFRVW